MKSMLLLLMATWYMPSSSSILPPIKNNKMSSFMVDGNCAQCAALIEKAGFIKKTAIVQWNQATKMATLLYDATKTNPSFIHKRIALAGFDNEEYLAPDDAYAKLPECCQYTRAHKTHPKKITNIEVVQNKEKEVPSAIKDTLIISENNQSPKIEKKSSKHTDHASPDLSESSKLAEKTEQTSEQHKSKDKTAVPSTSKNIPVKPSAKDLRSQAKPTENQPKVNQLVAVFDQYFAVKDGLVKTDGNTVSTQAKELLNAINLVDMQLLNPAEHTVWMKILKALKSDSESISKTTDPARQRQYFMPLSNNMYSLIKASNLGIPMYYQHCPMANKGKGADWLSKEMAVKNPYFGSQMMTCGNTKETIK